MEVHPEPQRLHNLNTVLFQILITRTDLVFIVVGM